MPTIKKELRKQLKESLAELTVEEMRERSSRAADLLTTQPEYLQSEIIMVFLSMQTEISTVPLVLKAWQDRKRVLAPRVSWEQRRMIPVEIHSLDDGVEETESHVLQPVEGDPIPISMIDLVVVPGLGFDSTGNRLGRGRGFYDRFLGQKEFRSVTCALAFEQQVVDSIPSDSHDIRVQMLVTEERVRRFDS